MNLNQKQPAPNTASTEIANEVADKLIKIRNKINDKFNTFEADELFELAEQLRALS